MDECVFIGEMVMLTVLVVFGAWMVVLVLAGCADVVMARARGR